MSAATRKSDTHQERYVHIPIAGHPRVFMATVFARQEVTGWWASIAICVRGDTFSRRIGRQMARRRFFAGESKYMHDGFTYSNAKVMVDRAVDNLKVSV